MDDISNRTVVLLLVVAIVVSLGGTMISLSKISSMGITGAATGSAAGTTNVTITSVTTLEFKVQGLDFGSGNVYSNCSNCNMTSNGTWTGGCCGGSWAATDHPLVIENTGNTNVDLWLNSTKNNSELLGQSSTVEPEFKWRMSTMSGQEASRISTLQSLGATGDDTAAACGTQTLYYTGWTTINSTDQFCICGPCSGSYGFEADNSRDEIVVDFLVSIPGSETGSKTSTIYATGVSA